MKSTKIKLAILSALAVVSASAGATGLVAIPAAGFTGTAYTSCNTTGNFGSSITTNPTGGANNTCAVFPANEAISPVAGFTLIANTSRPAVMNNSYTGNVDVTVGSVTDRVWRNVAKTECIYGTKFVPANVDYWDGEAGTQYFEVNDIARGGFNGSGSVNAGYYVATSTASPVYRIGRTYTSVQHRAYSYDTATNKGNVGTNYVSLPPSASGSTASINGEDATIDPTDVASTIAANQTAAVDSNWVDFTADVVFADDDGSTNPTSAMTYVQAACSADAPATVSNAIRLRQTAQEYARFIQVSVDGYVPPSGAAAPSPTNPY